MAVRGRALSLSEALELSVVTHEFNDPLNDEVRVRVDWAGICGSDLHVIRTGDWVEAWPAVLGHEIYGHVEALGSAVERSDLREGAPVVVDSRFTVDAAGITFVGEACEGGFAEYCVLPHRLLVRVPDELEGEVAVLAEPLATVLHALTAAPASSERALIIGHGPIGALTHVELRRRNPRLEISVAEPSSGRSELAFALGAATNASASSFSTADYDLVVDSAGYPGSIGDAARAASPHATVLVLAIGEREGGLTSRVAVEKQLLIRGSCAFTDELPHAVDLLARDPDSYRSVVTRAVGLDEAPGLIARQLERPDEVKVLVRP